MKFRNGLASVYTRSLSSLLVDIMLTAVLSADVVPLDYMFLISAGVASLGLISYLPVLVMSSPALEIVGDVTSINPFLPSVTVLLDLIPCLSCSLLTLAPLSG